MDTKGLIYQNRGDHLTIYKQKYAREENFTGKEVKKLIDVIKIIKPTALIGLSESPNSFDDEVYITHIDILNSF